MGEIAESMIEGGMCEQCGHIFDDECGYARLCEACSSEDKPATPTKQKRRRMKKSWGKK